MVLFGGVAGPAELGSCRRAAEAFKCLPSALFTLHLGLGKPSASHLLYPPHTLYNSHQCLEVQCCLNSKHLPPNYFSLPVHWADSASLNYSVYPLTAGLSRQHQPFAANVPLCDGKHPKHSAKKRKGMAPLINRESSFPSPAPKKTLKAGNWYSKRSIKLSQLLNDSGTPMAWTDVPFVYATYWLRSMLSQGTVNKSRRAGC